VIVLKLLLGLGKEEEFNPTLFNIFVTAVALGSAFFGSILIIIYISLSII